MLPIPAPPPKTASETVGKGLLVFVGVSMLIQSLHFYLFGSQHPLWKLLPSPKTTESQNRIRAALTVTGNRAEFKKKMLPTC